MTLNYPFEFSKKDLTALPQKLCQPKNVEQRVEIGEKQLERKILVGFPESSDYAILRLELPKSQKMLAYKDSCFELSGAFSRSVVTSMVRRYD